MRHGAKSVTNFELLPEPPQTRASSNPWPTYARIKRTDYGHQEVMAYTQKDPREYCISTKRFVIEDGVLKGLDTVQVEWENVGGQWKMEEVKGSEKFYPADLVLLALGFLGPEKALIEQLGVKQDARTNIATPQGQFATNVPGVFAAGDCRRGQS